MRRVIIAAISLRASSAQASPAVVRSIGLHQYTILDVRDQVFAGAYRVCAKLGRKMLPLGVPLQDSEAPEKNLFNFECILAYEVVPTGQETYTIHVPTAMMLAPADRLCPPPNCPIKGPTLLPDFAPAARRSDRLARKQCAKLRENVVIIGGSFDMGPGYTYSFKCVPSAQVTADH